ncbi:hypothetical protein SUDANB176_04565 [Streptomyces sp. enrichment culture]|uniref:hypothetical protein n=1 Tax=Streptomyces sp. enrichment culture TaxID=1795815 RepID=UPI003F56C6CD
MNENIRRSLVTAAGVTGARALGSAPASAEELPPLCLPAPDATPARTAGPPVARRTGAGAVPVAERAVGGGTPAGHAVTGAEGLAESVIPQVNRT